MKINFLLYTIVLLAFVLCVNSCCKGSQTSETIYNNESRHFIEVIPFSKDSAYNQNTFALRPYQTLSSSGYIFDTIQLDSVHIVFDNTFTRTHYYWDSTKYGNNPRALKYGDKRNFFGDGVSTGKKIGKCSYHSIYTYTFTEQDYLDAQK